MSIITISRGSYSKGKEIAEGVAEELGFECISREILLETSEHFNVPELKLARAIHDAPSFLNHIQHGKEKFMAYIRETLLERIRRDNIVYHGLAGHFLLQGIPHILKVRITANLDDRILEEMRRESFSKEKARHTLVKDDAERRKWGMRLYGSDTNDCGLYDVVLHIDSLKVAEAVEVLADLARRESFQLTPEIRNILDDQYLAAKVHAAIVNEFPTARVEGQHGSVLVNIETPLALEDKTHAAIVELTHNITSASNLRLRAIPIDVD